MLAGSLDLEEPWYITGAEFNPVKNVIDVHVGIRENAVIVCPHSGGPTNVTGMNPPSVHGVMLTVCFIRAMFTANVRELNETTVASSKSQHLLNGRTAATPCYSKDMP